MRKLYVLLRKILPLNWHSSITYLLYLLRIKPTVNKQDPSPFKKGVVVLSADFEMAWAFRYSKKRSGKAVDYGLLERENVPRLLELFEKFKIPITWATVGHLFLDNCGKLPNEMPHSDLQRPKYFENENWKFLEGDWYDHDPCTDYKTSPAWYAPDLIDSICNSIVEHEIGCHTFSHLDCTNLNCPPELIKQELEMCKILADRKGLKLRSMVFPGGTHGNFSIVKMQGFLAYRQKTKFNVDIPNIDEYGLIQIPSSYALEQSNNNWKSNTYIRISKSFVCKAAKNKLVTHFWFHPSMSEWYLENVMPNILAFICKLRDKGKIEVLTMGQVAERVLNKKISEDD